ncbi:MAG TPA: glycosyltransferase family 2 protein [Puia sp.]|nr:glycosyltransferase family 2 protein [Puia sp.]
MDSPLVSVLMTAYNREKFIAEAIESVLESSFTDLELIIVDDGSSDSTVSIAQSYAGKDSRVKVYINESNLGDYPNRNRAASYARGKYLKYLDSDDLLYRHGLAAFVDFMEGDQEVAMGISYRKNLTHRPFPVIMGPRESLRYHFFTEGFLDCAPTGTIIRRDCFEKLGRFSGKRMIGDLEFGLKTAIHYKVMILPPALAFWRNHGDQEVFIGINDNLYPALSEAVLKEQFTGLSDIVLTDAEKFKILQGLFRSHRKEWVKKFVKRILFLKK